ncbi:MAG: hypothetical protein R6W71_12310 [Bacteroidales bacterium]|jgi:hypothetical protein
MESKEKYVVENEVRVKNLLSDMYDSESSLLSKINKMKDKVEGLKSDIKNLEKDYESQKKLRKDLTTRFDDLKRSKASDWEEFKKEYELALGFAEGDKYAFMQKAEAFISELGKRINVLEKKMEKSSKQAREKTQKTVDELKEKQKDMQKKLKEARESTGDMWKDARQWFIEKANSLKEALNL